MHDASVAGPATAGRSGLQQGAKVNARGLGTAHGFHDGVTPDGVECAIRLGCLAWVASPKFPVAWVVSVQIAGAAARNAIASIMAAGFHSVTMTIISPVAVAPMVDRVGPMPTLLNSQYSGILMRNSR